MPSSIALPTTLLDAVKSMRPPKLLPPRPTTDTSSVEPPSLALFHRPIISLRAREPEDLPCLVGSGDLAPQPARDAYHALHQHGIVLGEFAGRDIGIVFVADAHVSAERDRERENRPLLLRVHDAHVPDAVLRKIIDHELEGALGRRRPGSAGPADE